MTLLTIAAGVLILMGIGYYILFGKMLDDLSKNTNENLEGIKMLSLQIMCLGFVLIGLMLLIIHYVKH